MISLLFWGSAGELLSRGTFPLPASGERARVRGYSPYEGIPHTFGNARSSPPDFVRPVLNA